MTPKDPTQVTPNKACFVASVSIAVFAIISTECESAAQITTPSSVSSDNGALHSTLSTMALFTLRFRFLDDSTIQLVDDRGVVA